MKTRSYAFFVHLVGSFLCILILLCVMRFSWYPTPYFETQGGWLVLGFMMAVGFVSGPLLTLIVFKPKKQGLSFDLFCIFLIQLSILVYGGLIIYQQRPAFLVFAIDRFIVMPTAEIDFNKIQNPKLKDINRTYPHLIQARLPNDLKTQQDFTFEVLSGKERDIEFHPEWYEIYQPDFSKLRSRTIDIQKIADIDYKAQQSIERFIKQREGHLEEYFYLPLKGKIKDIVIVLSAKDGLPAGFISISPWLIDYPAAIQ